MTNSDDIVPTKEIAAYFGLTTAAIYKYVRQGRIRSRGIGRSVRITREEFDYIKTHGLREPENKHSEDAG